MRTFVVRTFGWTACAALLFGPQLGEAQSTTGRITGRVTGGTGAAVAPVEGARVQLVGTQRAVPTSATGEYVLANLAPGSYVVRVSFIGYAAQSRPVTVADGQGATADFALVRAATQLDVVVTTATGQQSSRTQGNAVSSINAADRVQNTAVANVSDLLVAKAPGVQVLGSSLTGGGQRIRIRGQNSLSLNNEPIVVIDGVRMTSDNNSSSIGIGGTNPSRFSDLNPEEIERIEIVKGPSAATLYGTDAANGVIVITTKRGRAGRPELRAYTEQGLITDRTDYIDNYRAWRTGPTAATTSVPTNTVQCFLTQTVTTVAANRCTQDSVSRFNLYDDEDSSPLGTGRRQQYGLQLSGGSDVARYFLSGEWEDEVGVYEMPQFARDSILARRGTAAPEDQVRPNALRRTSLRANLNLTPVRALDVSVSTGFITSDQRLPQSDNNVTGLFGNTSGGAGNKDNGLFGYRTFTPDGIFAETTRQAINRFIGSSNANWRPLEWLAARGTAGIDYTARNESELCRRDQCVPFGTRPLGFKGNNRSEFFQYTGDMGATATVTPFENVESRTTVGGQYVGKVFARNGAFGENLTPGATQAGAGAIQQVTELRDESRTLGFFVEEQVGWRERLFVTAAVRTDRNSAFGREFDAVYYPKGSLSWVVSEESFFPGLAAISNLRLRAAAGASGVQPEPTDATRYFTATQASAENADVPALVFTALGNPDLKPERSTELEYGADLGLFANRLTLEITGYTKRTEDALIQRIVFPSAGTATSRFENIGSVKNRGVEFLLSGQLLQRDAIGIDLSLNGSTNRNRIVSLGETPAIVGATRQQRVGYPVDGYWQRQIRSYDDANGDGVITAAELVVDDTATYVGPDKPTLELSFQGGVDLFRKRLRVQALVDRKSGQYLLNGTERIRCESRNNCEGAIDPAASLFQKARATAVREHPSRTQGGYIEKADFTRIREVSATLTLPERLLRSTRTRSASLTFAARNLALFSDYTGLDPESNYFEGARGTVSDFQTAPPPSLFTLRLNVGF